MSAGLSVAVDKDGRERCVVVVKGTFTVDATAGPRLAQEQEPLTYADVHFGDPGKSSIRYECDFAPVKRMTDVIVNGSAHAPQGRLAAQTTVEIAIGSLRKSLRVTGDRRWEFGIGGWRATDPVPFASMPIVYERAFGGSDLSHPDERHHATELRNPVGVGLRKNSDAIAGTHLPNVEDPKALMRQWSDTPPPQGFAGLGRGWQPRIAHAGTYDQAWRDQRFPFLPADFDDRYFLCTPADQQLPLLKGGERFSCRNMTPQGEWGFDVPRVHVPVRFRFSDRDAHGIGMLDTLIVEPDAGRFIAVWRASVELGRKMNQLREVLVGRPQPSVPLRWRSGKPHFASLADLERWRRREEPAASDA